MSKHDDTSGQHLSGSGNGGLNGCVDYKNLVYTTSLGFASTGDNGGHDGPSIDGSAFLDNDNIIDFAYRSRHTTVLSGKQVVEQYYGRPHKTSYYYGCSTGGRQGMKSAQMFPEDFDGIVAGSPATDFNHLGAWTAHFLTLTGTNASDPRFLSDTQLTAVTNEIYRQCDTIDRVADGIIEDSSICNFNPETLLCNRGPIAQSPMFNGTCLSNTQVQTVRNIFLPLYGLNETFVYPRLSPGADLFDSSVLQGQTTTLGGEYYRYAILSDPSWDPTTFSALDIKVADSLDPAHGFISSFSGDLYSFKSRGGKILTYHGGADPIISGEQSMRYYQHVAKTMSFSNADMDSFYRLFPISGMAHCEGGQGAWAFGQRSTAANSTDNILMDLVRWTEGGAAPERIVGEKWVNDSSILGVKFKRAHCRYPYRTTYVGGDPDDVDSWDCRYIEGVKAASKKTQTIPAVLQEGHT
ncbi:putative feruloyl esterase b [Phaeomoniella chlamydospora]|uniref:Carboxylic ester hydrolase n=1 Tax=Phaeomoniella chlamydospora TaxID=158046 RepID=A0A0G2E1I3_PHACM|nr:putative feruloyl esterase b [Phaeomoniella chlamydospora]